MTAVRVFTETNITPERWMPEEEWRPVLGFEGAYEVSSIGRVRSLDRIVERDYHGAFRIRGRMLKSWLSPEGYPRVNLSVNGNRRCYQVHVLVCEAWHGPRPEGMFARHLDDVPAHISPDNLAWGTPLQNARDAIRNGKNALLKRTHCIRNHPYDDSNTYVDRQGHRRCRACAAQYFRDRRARIREERLRSRTA